MGCPARHRAGCRHAGEHQRPPHRRRAQAAVPPPHLHRPRSRLHAVLACCRARGGSAPRPRFLLQRRRKHRPAVLRRAVWKHRLAPHPPAGRARGVAGRGVRAAAAPFHHHRQLAWPAGTRDAPGDDLRGEGARVQEVHGAAGAQRALFRDRARGGSCRSIRPRGAAREWLARRRSEMCGAGSGRVSKLRAAVRRRVLRRAGHLRRDSVGLVQRPHRSLSRIRQAGRGAGYRLVTKLSERPGAAALQHGRRSRATPPGASRRTTRSTRVRPAPSRRSSSIRTRCCPSCWRPWRAEGASAIAPFAASNACASSSAE